MTGEMEYVQKIGNSGYWVTNEANPDAIAIPRVLWERYLSAQYAVDALADEIEEYDG